MEHQSEVALKSLEFHVWSQFMSTYQRDRKRQENLNVIKIGKLQVETSIKTKYPLFPSAVQITKIQFWLKNLHSIFSKPSFY